jgi:hypothetical protein
VRRKSHTIVNAVTEKDEELRTASHRECEHCDEEECGASCTQTANNNPGQHHAADALKNTRVISKRYNMAESISPSQLQSRAAEGRSMG